MVHSKPLSYYLRGPPEFTPLPLEQGSPFHAFRMDIDVTGGKAAQAAWQKSFDAHNAWAKRVNEHAAQARVHLTKERARHRPSPSPSPPLAPQPATQPQAQPIPLTALEDLDHASPAPPPMPQALFRISNPASPPAHLVGLDEAAWADRHEQEGNQSPRDENIPTGIPRATSVESHWEEANTKNVAPRRETSKRTLAEADEEEDHKGKEFAWIASKRQKRHTDIEKQELRGDSRPAQAAGKGQNRQMKTGKAGRFRVAKGKAGMRQKQRAGRGPYTRSTLQKSLISLHPTKKGAVMHDKPAAADKGWEDEAT